MRTRRDSVFCKLCTQLVAVIYLAVVNNGILAAFIAYAHRLLAVFDVDYRKAVVLQSRILRYI